MENLTNSVVINTEFDVVQVDWTFDGEQFMCLVKKSDEFFQIRQYCALSFTLLRTRDLTGDYIKA